MAYVTLECVRARVWLSPSLRSVGASVWPWLPERVVFVHMIDRVSPPAAVHFSIPFACLPRAASACESIPRKIMSGSRRPSMDGGRRLSLGLTTTDEQIKPAWAAFLDAGEVCRPPIASRCAHPNPPGARIWPSHPSRPGPSRSRPLS